MAIPVSCLSSSRGHAEAILASLREIGVDQHAVMVTDPHPTDPSGRAPERTPEGMAAGALAGAATGGVLGLFVGIGALIVPGAALGAAAGVVAGAVLGKGIPETLVSGHEDRLREGHMLILVNARDDAEADRVVEVFTAAEAEEISRGRRE
jgi:uncharacterized membrane protein